MHTFNTKKQNQNEYGRFCVCDCGFINLMIQQHLFIKPSNFSYKTVSNPLFNKKNLKDYTTFN